MSKLVSLLTLVSITLAAIAPLHAQQQTQPQPDDVVRITSNLVQMDAVVTGKDGKPITDLTVGDFEVLQDGKSQKVVSASYVNTDTTDQSVERKKTDPKAAPAPPPPPVRTQPGNIGRVLTFVVDDGNCAVSQGGIAASRQALEKFVNEQMRPEDSVAIYQTRSGSSMLQQLTSDKAQLMKVVRQIRWYPPRGMCANEATGDVFDKARSNTTSKMRDDGVPVSFESDMDRESRNKIENRARDNQVVGLIGVLSYITRGLRRVAGRKTVFLLSDGIPLFATSTQLKGADNAPIATMKMGDSSGVMRDLIDSANRASVVFNTIDVRGVLNPFGEISARDEFDGVGGKRGDTNAISKLGVARASAISNSQSGMSYLANETGGRFYDDAGDLSVPVKRALSLEKGYYLIGYQPDAETFKSKRFNKIEIKVKRPDANVRSRSGFLGITEESLHAPSINGESDLYEAIAAPLPKAGLNLQLTAFFANTAAEGSFVRTLVYVDGEQVSFVDEPNGIKKAVFDVVAVTLNEKNAVVDEFNKTHSLSFPAEYVDMVKQDGLIYSVDVPVKQPGAYNFRMAIRDVNSKLIGSAGQQIEVPDLLKDGLVLSELVLGEVVVKDGKPVLPSLAKVENGFAAGNDVSSPAIRRFQPGAVLSYAYTIFNAQLDKATRQPKVSVQVKLYREGQVITEGAAEVAKFEGQTDMTRISDRGYLRLPPETLAGSYALQIIIKDLQSNRTTSQSIDFEVIK
jgi:VWFA-related protein